MSDWRFHSCALLAENSPDSGRFELVYRNSTWPREGPKVLKVTTHFIAMKSKLSHRPSGQSCPYEGAQHLRAITPQAICRGLRTLF